MSWQQHVGPGDVLVCHDTSWAAKLIQISAVLRGLPAANHIAVVTHTDAAGTLWGKEGRPGGVGDVDCARYLHNPFTVANVGQPKTATQRAAVVATVNQLNGTAYDWQAIAEDAGLAFGLKDIWQEKVNGVVPGHIVCSSLAAYAYDRAGLTAPAPQDFRHVSPGDWASLIAQHHWAEIAASPVAAPG